MRQQYRLLQFLLSNFFILACAPAYGQITPDNTLGTEASRLNPNVLINGAPGDKIDGGAVRGSNLFHSFSEFNLGDGQRVYFGNPSGVENILTRVTGGNPSNIFGTLGVDGTANLFLLNPNGILFGPNARLDVRGSFLGTTANSFVFPNGVFSAKNPQAPPLLTISVPIGLGFGSQPGGITSQGNQLGVFDSTLSLIGGEITLDGSLLFANNGQVQLGAVGGDKTVDLNVNGSELNFNLAENANRAPITLTNRSEIFTNGDSAIELVGGQIKLNNSFLSNRNGGSISIDAIGLSLDNNSSIETNTEGATNAGDIQIQASDAVTLTKSSLIGSQSRDSATGNGGDISINAKAIAITGDGTANNSSGISAFTGSKSDGRDLTLSATDSININGGSVSVITNGAGNAGNLTVRAGNAINVTNIGLLGLFSSGSGSTGDLRIETGTLRVQNAGNIGGVTAGADDSGSVGSISIQARDRVEVIDSPIRVQVSPGSVGQAGDVIIETQRVNLRDGGQISTDTFSDANAGNVTIRASESVDIDGISLANGLLYNSEVSSTTGRATGNGGNITIETPRLTLTQGGSVSTTSFQSQGNAGNINIRAEDVQLDGFVTVPKEFFSEQFQIPDVGLSIHSELSSEVSSSDADVRGGTITIDTERLRLSNGAQVSASAFGGRGQGGNLLVRATDLIDITGVGGKRINGSFAPSGLFADLQTGGIGAGGSISVETRRLNMSNGGKISASTFNQGNAGDITIRADQIDLRGENTVIRTQVNSEAMGNGGNLSILGDRLTLGDGAELSSGTLGTGDGGNLTINARDSVEVIGSSNDNRFQSTLSVSSRGQGQAGNLTVNSPRISVKDKGVINAESSATDGGNINLNTNLLLLRRGGNISATAGLNEGAGNGGNIKINSPLIVAVLKENSDISANAFQGSGGNVTIKTKGIFGIVPASSPTPQSDITASSQLGLQGQINIIQPDVQPTQGLIELPTQLVDASDQIGQNCPTGRNAKKPLGEFVVSGRGSLPPSALQPLVGTPKLRPLATLSGDSTPVSTSSTPTIPPTQTPLVEAQGWVKTPDGKIILVASVPAATPSSPPTASVCPVSK